MLFPIYLEPNGFAVKCHRLFSFLRIFRMNRPYTMISAQDSKCRKFSTLILATYRLSAISLIDSFSYDEFQTYAENMLRTQRNVTVRTNCPNRIWIDAIDFFF